MTLPRSLLPIILAADNFPSSPKHDPYPLSNPSTKETYTPFHLTFPDFQARLPSVGILRPSVLAELQSDERDDETCPWRFHHSARPSVEDEDELELEVICVFFADWVVKGGRDEMGRVMKETVETWRDEGKFAPALSG